MLHKFDTLLCADGEACHFPCIGTRCSGYGPTPGAWSGIFGAAIVTLTLIAMNLQISFLTPPLG